MTYFTRFFVFVCFSEKQSQLGARQREHSFKTKLQMAICSYLQAWSICIWDDRKTNPAIVDGTGRKPGAAGWH